MSNVAEKAMEQFAEIVKTQNNLKKHCPTCGQPMAFVRISEKPKENKNV